MPIESYIPLQVRPLQLDPIGDATKALSLQKLLLGDRLRGAFVFDETPNGPQLNVQRTRQNLYSIDPEAAMNWERQQDMRDHWLGQRAYQQATLQSAEANRFLKEQSLDLQRTKAALARLNMDWMEDKGRTPDQKLPLYMQQYDQILRGGGNAAKSYMERGLLPQKYDFDAIDKFIVTPDESFVKTAAGVGAPTMMTDEGDVLSGQSQDDGLVETAGATRLAPGMLDSLRTGGGTARSSRPTSRAEALAEAYVLRSEAEGIKGTDSASKQRKQFLLSQAKSLIELRKPWNPGEDYVYDPEKNQWVPNEFAISIKERKARAGKPETSIYLPGEKKADEEFGKAIGGAFDKELADSFKKARSSAANVSNILETKRLVDKGIFTGKLANWKQSMYAYLNAMGMQFSKDELSNTQTFVASVANQLLPMTHLLGTGNGFTDNDRQFLYVALGGDMTLTDDAIKKITDMTLRAAMLQIKAHNQFKDQILEDERDGPRWRKKLQVNIDPKTQAEVDRYLNPPKPTPPAAKQGATPVPTLPTKEPQQTSVTLPAEAVSRLKEGVITEFKNGQSWTLKNGNPVRVK